MGSELDTEQLLLLMQSYKEQVQLNTRLLERQERFIDNLDKSTQQLVEAINTQTKGLSDMFSTGLAQLSQKMTEDHGGLNIRIYVALVGMVSILATLITLWAIT